MSRGKVLGDRYKIGEKIGSGGFSTVYFCVDLQVAVDSYLEDRRKEYEEYRLCFEMMKAEERTSTTTSGGGKKSGGKGGRMKGVMLGNPVTFEELCGRVPSPEDVIHPDVLQALLTTGKVPMITSDAAIYLGGGQGRKCTGEGTATYPSSTGKDKCALLSPTLYRSNSPAPSSLASSAASRTTNTNNLFQNANNAAAMNGVVVEEPGVLIHWGRTVIPPVYAVKVLNKAQLKHLCMEDAFEREVEAMKAITRTQPSNVINVLDVLQSTRNYYLVMDLADQGSLLAVIVRNNATLTGGGGGGLPGPAARKYFRQLINGLSFVHGADVVHRDIKPENLLLDRWRDVRISDFGFAAYSPPGRMLTRPCGTPQYAAPEVLVDNPRYDGRKVDMWSSGITLFVIAFGCLPFYANTNEKLYSKITGGVYEIPTTLRKPPPPSLIHLLSVLLDTNPKSRWSVEMVRVHPWVLGRDDIPERLQDSYLLTMKRRYMLEKRKMDRSGGRGGGKYITSPVENDGNPLARKTSTVSSLPAASKSFLALTSAAGIDPTKVQNHLHQQPMLGRSLGSDTSSTNQHEQEMEALMMELGDELNDDDFMEGTDGFLFVQQHRRNVATVTQASCSCPNLRQIQGGFVVDGGRSKDTGNNQLHRGVANTPPTDGIQSGNGRAFFTIEPSDDFCVSCPAAAAEALAEEHSNTGDDCSKPQTVAVESVGSGMIHTNNSLNTSGGVGGANISRGGQSQQQSTNEPNTFRGSHLLDMLEHSIGDGSITVDVETGLLVLLDGLDVKQRIRLQKAAEKALEANPGVEVTRYAKVLTPLLAHFDRIHSEEHELNVAGESATGWGGSQSAIGYPATPGTTSASTRQNSMLSSTSFSPAAQDITVHKRYPPGNKYTPPLNHHHSRSDSFSNTRYPLDGPGGSKSSTPSSRPQSTPGTRAGRGSVSGGESTPEDIKNREKRSAFRRLGLLHIQIVLNFIAVFGIIFVAGTAKVLFDVDVAKWPMPAFLRRFIDRILSPPKQASASTTGGSSAAGFHTARSSPGGNFNHHHSNKTSPGMDSMSSSYSRTPNWSHSPSSVAQNSFATVAGYNHHHHHHHHHHHQRPPGNTSFGSTPHLYTPAGVMGASRHQRTPSNTKSSLTDTPRPLETQPPNSNDHGPRLFRPPSTFTLSSTPLTTASTVPMGRSPGQLPHTNSPSTGIQFPASEPPPNLGGSLYAPVSTLLRPRPTRKHSNLSSASSDDACMPRTMTAQHSEHTNADPVPAGSVRLLQPTASLMSPPGSDGHHTDTRTFLNSSFHSGDSNPPPLPLPSEAVIRQDETSPQSQPTLPGPARGGLKKVDGSSAPPTASPILKRVKLPANAYRRSGVSDEDLPDHVNGILADEDSTNQQGFKPSQQAKMGLHKMKRIDSHVAPGGCGGGDLADMDEDDMSLAT